MPNMSGFELLKKVRANDDIQEVPFLMVTAEAEKHNIMNALEAGVSNYIIKPFKPSVLKEKLEKIL